MAYRPTELGHLVQLHPERAKQRILKALQRTDGNVRMAAEALGVSRPGLYRYIAILKLEVPKEALP